MNSTAQMKPSGTAVSRRELSDSVGESLSRVAKATGGGEINREDPLIVAHLKLMDDLLRDFLQLPADDEEEGQKK